MNISKEQVDELLPQTVKDTDVLSEDAKNMFAVLLNSLLVSKGAEDTGVLIKATDELRKYVGWRFERMMNAIRELEKYELITRIPGKKRVEGESSVATKFIFNWDIIEKPIVKKTHDDLFAKFKMMKTSGNTNGNCNSNGNSNDNINEKVIINYKANSSENSNVNENSNLSINDKDKLEDEKEQFEMERFMVEEYIKQKANGKKYSEITSLTIPIYNWIESEFPKNSKRLKNIANSRLNSLKRDSFDSVPSTTPVISEYEANLPF